MLFHYLVRLRVLGLLLCQGHAVSARTVTKGCCGAGQCTVQKLGRHKLSGNENGDAKPEEERMDTEQRKKYGKEKKVLHQLENGVIFSP